MGRVFLKFFNSFLFYGTDKMHSIITSLIRYKKLFQKTIIGKKGAETRYVLRHGSGNLDFVFEMVAEHMFLLPVMLFNFFVIYDNNRITINCK